ncbi:hypothetical protein [Microbacterium sp. GXF6406]
MSTSAFGLDAILDAAAEEVLDKPGETIGVTIGATEITVELPYIGGIRWSDLVAANPPRSNATGDLVVGYNETGLALEYAKRWGILIQPDGERVKPDGEQWNRLFNVAGAPVINSIALTLYVMNVQMPMDRASAAGKDSSASSKTARA